MYVLELKSTPVYVGIARGKKGFAGRLTNHHFDEVKDWTHFSWFSFDGIKDVGTKADPCPEQWAYIDDRNKLQAGDVKARIEEMEALMVGRESPREWCNSGPLIRAGSCRSRT